MGIKNKFSVSLIILASFVCTWGFAQSDSILLRQLSKPVITCETISINSQQRLISYQINEADSINAVLNIWETYCGNCEPINRIKLLLAISAGASVDSSAILYLNNDAYLFRYRMRMLEQSTEYTHYETQKSALSYVPLHSEFDNWTMQIAKKMLIKQLEGSSEYFICLYLSGRIDEANELLNSKLYKYSPLRKVLRSGYYNQPVTGMDFTFYSGVWIPVGKMNQYFNPGPLFGVKFGFDSQSNHRIDFVFQMGVMIKPTVFNMMLADTLTPTKSDMNLLAGISYTHGFDLKDSWKAEATAGLAYGMFDTDIKKPLKKNQTEDSYYTIGAPDISVEAGIRRILRSGHSFGLGIGYHYLPLSVNQNLDTNIGSQMLMIVLGYRF